MPTIVGILTVISKINAISECLKGRKKYFQYFSFYELLNFYAELGWAWKKLYNLGASCLILLCIRKGLHRLEKYLNIQDCLEKSLKINLALKSTWKHSKALKSPWILPFTGGFNAFFGDLNQYKIVVSSFGAAYAAPIKGTTILY